MGVERYPAWPEGARVRFTVGARTALNEPRHQGPSSTPKGGPDRGCTAGDTPDDPHDIALRENTERGGVHWSAPIESGTGP